MPRIDSSVQTKVVSCWHDNQFARTAVVSKSCGVGAYAVRNFYPFDRYGNTFRVDQAIRCIDLHDDHPNEILRAKYGFSSGTLAKARCVIAAVKGWNLTLTDLVLSASVTGSPRPGVRNYTHDPEQVTAGQNVRKLLPLVAPPRGSRFVDKSFQGVINVAKLTTERGRQYGHPLDDFKRVSAGKEVLAACSDPEVRHALEMIWVKMCRLATTPTHVDSINDIAGYAETIHMIHAERKRRK